MDPTQLKQKHGEDKAFQATVSSMLDFIVPEDSRQREGLKETPARVCKAWRKWTEGYHEDVASVFKAFEDGGEKYDQMVCELNIPFSSVCEHHLAHFWGTAAIAYIPNGRIIGLSKLSRLLDIFAHRLQVQERITQQVADAMEEYLKPRGVAVFLRARHTCMESRGICRAGIETTTMALRGALKDEAATRAEFMALIK
jgi:GTP cyclohydrolase I